MLKNYWCWVCFVFHPQAWMKWGQTTSTRREEPKHSWWINYQCPVQKDCCCRSLCLNTSSKESKELALLRQLPPLVHVSKSNFKFWWQFKAEWLWHLYSSLVAWASCYEIFGEDVIYLHLHNVLFLLFSCCSVCEMTSWLIHSSWWQIWIVRVSFHNNDSSLKEKSFPRKITDFFDKK